MSLSKQPTLEQMFLVKRKATVTSEVLRNEALSTENENENSLEKNPTKKRAKPNETLANNLKVLTNEGSFRTVFLVAYFFTFFRKED